MKGTIDAHVHVWTPDTQKYPLAPGYKKENMQPPSFTPEELFAHCKPEGVERIVLIQMSFYGFDNSYMLDAMRTHPGVLVELETRYSRVIEDYVLNARVEIGLISSTSNLPPLRLPRPSV